MPFERPTITDLYQRISNDIETRLDVIGASLRTGFVKVLSKVLAGIAHLMYGYLDWTAKQLFPDTAESENLDRWGSIWEISRTPASYAEGSLTFTGDNDTVIPEDTELVTADGVKYKTTEEGTIAAGTATVTARALTAGEVGNSDVGSVFSLETPITGLDSTATVSTEFTGGVDEESDDDYRTRVLERIAEPPLGGAEQDYVAWAKSVAGVTRAWAYPRYLGAGTVGIFFVRDNDEDSIFPDEGEIEDVSAVIETNKPVTADHYVFSPTADPVDFNVVISPDNSAVRYQVEQELADLIEREAEPGGVIYLSHIQEAISLAAGESDHTLLSPTADFESENGYMPTMGDVTFS